MTKEQTQEYPYNLYLVVTNRSSCDAVPQDFISSIEYAVSTFLSERNQKILKMRFQSQTSLTTIGLMFGVSSSRVQNIIAESIRELRHPEILKYFELGVLGVVRDATIRAAKDAVAEANKRMVVRVENGVLIGENRDIALVGFSTRAYNALRHRNICCADEIAVLGWDGLMKIRNLGAKTVKEICDKMIELGYPASAFKPRKI